MRDEMEEILEKKLSNLLDFMLWNYVWFFIPKAKLCFSVVASCSIIAHVRTLVTLIDVTQGSSYCMSVHYLYHGKIRKVLRVYNYIYTYILVVWRRNFIK